MLEYLSLWPSCDTHPQYQPSDQVCACCNEHIISYVPVGLVSVITSSSGLGAATTCTSKLQVLLQHARLRFLLQQQHLGIRPCCKTTALRLAGLAVGIALAFMQGGQPKHMSQNQKTIPAGTPTGAGAGVRGGATHGDVSPVCVASQGGCLIWEAFGAPNIPGLFYIYVVHSPEQPSRYLSSRKPDLWATEECCSMVSQFLQICCLSWHCVVSEHIWHRSYDTIPGRNASSN